MTRTAVGLGLLLAASAPAVAQHPDTITALADRLGAQVAELQSIERDMMPPAGASLLRRAAVDQVERWEQVRAEVVLGLDALVGAGAAGRREVTRLAAAFPGMDLVRRAEVRAALAARDLAGALALADELQHTAPRDTQLLRWRADAYDGLERRVEALRARQARWELAPEDPEAWSVLVAAHERAGTLARLRESVGRIRLLHPDSHTVREQEIEILHRLGRHDEAARVASGQGVPR